MSFENASITWGANQLAAMVKNERIVFGNIVQRSFVWERARKSRFIESLCINVPIPPTYAKRFDDGSGKRNSNVYDILDGKQRLSTIKQYINDEFALSELSPITYFDEFTNEDVTIDVTNMKFSELPEGLQEKIKNARISVIYFDNLTKEEERELFKRLNAGKPLSTKSRLLASCKDIEGLLDIGSHKLFDEMLSDKARDNKNQVSIVMKVWCMMNQDIEDISFESKSFNPILENAEITETEKLAMIEVFNLIAETHDELIERKEKKIAKKLYTETHMVSLVPFFKQSVENGVDSEMMADWIVDFFESENNEYDEAAGAGSAKTVNVQTRHNALAESYTEFFKTDDEEMDELIDTDTDTESITDSIMNDIMEDE